MAAAGIGRDREGGAAVPAQPLATLHYEMNRERRRGPPVDSGGKFGAARLPERHVNPTAQRKAAAQRIIHPRPGLAAAERPARGQRRIAPVADQQPGGAGPGPRSRMVHRRQRRAERRRLFPARPDRELRARAEEVGELAHGKRRSLPARYRRVSPSTRYRQGLPADRISGRRERAAGHDRDGCGRCGQWRPCNFGRLGGVRGQHAHHVPAPARQQDRRARPGPEDHDRDQEAERRAGHSAGNSSGK